MVQAEVSLLYSRLHLAALLVGLGALPRPECDAGLVQGPGSVQGQPAVQYSTVQYSTVQRIKKLKLGMALCFN